MSGSKIGSKPNPDGIPAPWLIDIKDRLMLRPRHICSMINLPGNQQGKESMDSAFGIIIRGDSNDYSDTMDQRLCSQERRRL